MDGNVIRAIAEGKARAAKAKQKYEQENRGLMQARESANQWTSEQASRLHTTESYILNAIKTRGWTPEQIAGVTSKYQLEDYPGTLRT